jgi:hypothetical protein
VRLDVVEVASESRVRVVLCWLQFRLVKPSTCLQPIKGRVTYEYGLKYAIDSKVCSGQIVADEVCARYQVGI